MASLGFLLNSAQTLANLNAYQKRDESLYTRRKDSGYGAELKKEKNSLYKQREASGYYDELAESNPELASMQKYVDRMNAEAGSVVENMLSTKPSMDAIMAKMNAGQKLSPAELEHLKKADPELYCKAVQIAAERKAYEEKLKNCKTKEEVQRVKLTALSSIMGRVNDITNNPNIPEDKKLAMLQHEGRRAQAINEATAEYAKTTEYAQKPAEAERNREDKAERTEREKAAAPGNEAVEKPQGKTPGAGKPQQPGGGWGTAAAGRPGGSMAEAEPAEPAPLPGEGKSAAAERAEALTGDFKPGRASVKRGDAHRAYRQMQMMKAWRNAD